MRFFRAALVVAFCGSALAAPATARAQEKRAPRAKAVAAKPAAHRPPSRSKKTPKPAETSKAAEAEPQHAGSETPAAVRPPEGAEPAGAKAKEPVKADEGPEGVKTYHFGEIEVEGRLKSPQLIYFMRRVRAEFDAGALGHRSFLGELSDTRQQAVFR